MQRFTSFVVATLACATLSAAIAIKPAHGQATDDYPNRPVRLIIPQQPGAASDVLGRVFAHKFGESLGQSIVIDNRAGAGGIIGAEAAAKSTPDGYTLLLGASAWLTISPHTYKKLAYDALNDFAPVSLFAIGQNLLVVNPSVKASTVKELVALMQEKPNEINMASAGVGSASHLAGLLLNSLTGAKAVHVPYKGAGQSVGALVSGEAHWSFTPLSAPLSHVRSGRLRPIAVGSATRSPTLPDVPTVAESGYPEYNAASWYGILLPKGAPNAIVERVHAAVSKTLAQNEMKEQLINQGAEPKGNTPAEFGQFIRQDFERMAKVVKLAGLKAD